MRTETRRSGPAEFWTEVYPLSDGRWRANLICQESYRHAAVVIDAGFAHTEAAALALGESMLKGAMREEK
jgi:hypothetical protein